MATALAVIKAGFRAKIYERYPYARPAGNILNLWPPPIHALASMGVDVKDIGAPCHGTFRNSKGHIRADVKMPKHIIDQYGGGFVGLLRPDLYTRMLAAIPAGTIEFNHTVTEIQDHGSHVSLKFGDDKTVTAKVLIGADGIDSFVRAHLWGDTPKRNHDLHIIGGFTFDGPAEAESNECVLMHDRYVQGTYSAIRSAKGVWATSGGFSKRGRIPSLPPRATPIMRSVWQSASKVRSRGLVAATAEANFQRWPIRDRVPLKKWSKGRISLAGDAAHATSPYAAYGAGMSICDGYFLGQCLHGVDLEDTRAVVKALEKYEAYQLDHTTNQVNQAYFLGRLFHHMPFLSQFSATWFLTGPAFLQRQVGDRNPQDIISQLSVMGKGITMD